MKLKILLYILMSFTNLRLTRELAKLKDEKIDGIKILDPKDLRKWNAIVTGPSDTPYANHQFNMEIKFNDDYPVKPPSVKFVSPIFHPNVYRDGKICVDILQGEWSPAQNVRTILVSIRSLLMDPNPNSPANRDAAVIFKRDIEEYNKKVKSFLSKNSNHTV